MKYCIIPFAAVIVLMSACQKKESVANPEDQSGMTLTIHASVADDTRTYFEKDGNVYHPYWNATDAINVVYPGEWSRRSTFTNTQADGQDAVFSGKFSKKLEPGTYTLCAYYPSSASMSNSGEGLYKFTVKAAQTIPSLDTFDPSADLLIAQPTPLVLEEELSTSTNKSVEMRFRRAVAVAKVIFTDNTTVSEKSLASHHITDFSLTYNTSGIIAGKIGVKMDDMQTADNCETASKSVSVHYDGNDFKADGNCSAYVVVSPVTLLKNKKLLINVVTEDNALAISKEITLPDDIVFVAGKVVPLRVSLTDDNVTILNLSPEITFSQPEKLAYDAESGSFAYSIANAPDGAVASASITSGTWISNVAVSGNTVTFDCEKNDAADAEERTAKITLSYSGAADVEVTVTQGINIGPEDYVWDFSTTAWQGALDAQAPDAKDTKYSNWYVSYDGLSYTAGSDDRWSVNGYIQPNGSGYYKSETSKRRYFLFATSGPGYVYVTVVSNSSSEKTADICAQLGYKNDADFKVSTTAGSTSITKELGPFTTGGDIAVFLGASGLRIQKIEFHTNQQ